MDGDGLQLGLRRDAFHLGERLPHQGMGERQALEAGEGGEHQQVIHLERSVVAARAVALEAAGALVQRAVERERVVEARLDDQHGAVQKRGAGEAVDDVGGEEAVRGDQALDAELGPQAHAAGVLQNLAQERAVAG